MNYRLMKLCGAASAAILIAGCTEPAGDAAETPAGEPEAAVEAVAEPMVEAETTTDPNQIGTATVTIGIIDGAPKFTYIQSGYCSPNGTCVGGGGTSPTGVSGDVDLSTFPPGDVLITITLNADAIGAGYSFPSDGYQAVGISVFPPGGPVPPVSFGAQYWPSGFLAPAVSSDSHSVSFTDLESDQSVYEYSIGLNGPNGRVVMDPKIENGGGTGHK